MYKVAKERSYPANVPPLKVGGVVQKDHRNKPIPRRGPIWFVSEDGHETWWDLDRNKVQQEVDKLNALR